MTGFPFATVAFDLDGTLLETHKDLGTAVNHALTLGGFARVPLDSAADLIGGGARIMLKRALDAQGGADDSVHDALYDAMLGYYAQHYAVHTRPYPGVAAMLDALAGEGAALAVVTNKFEVFARGVLEALGLADRFACIVGGDTLGSGKAKPAPDLLWHAQAACGGGAMAFVGDSSFDVRAARAAGVPVVAVTYGYGDAPPHTLGADATVDSLAELVPALRRLAPGPARPAP